jgi:hypothetical protein
MLSKMTPYKTQLQIKAILRRIQEGKVKNIYSAQNKIKQLENSLKIANERERINNWLAQ